MATKSVKFASVPKKTLSVNKNKHKEVSESKKIEQLTAEKKNYIKIIYSLQSELFSFRSKLVSISKLEQEIKLYQSKCSSLENEVEQHKKEIFDLKEKYNEELRQKDTSYIDEIRKLKIENENIKTKVGMTNDLTREKNGLLKAFNIILNEKNELLVKHDKSMRQMAIDTQMKMTKMKNKLIESVSETQVKASELNSNYMDVTSKLTLLQNHQLLIQLEYLEQQLSDITNKNENLEKKINILNNEIQVHKEVEISLAEKNKKFLKEISRLKELEKREKDNNEKDGERNLSPNHSALNLGGASDKTNMSTTRAIQLENKVINLEKRLQLKQKEYNEIKEKSDYFEKVLKNYEKKYTGLFKYFEDCLKMFFSDEDLKNNKDLNIDIDLMKKGDFTSLNEKEKYSTLVILMKYLMPLIYNTESLSDFNNLNNINLKFYSKKKKIRIYKNHGFNKANNINQNIFKKMMNKKGGINPESIISSSIKYNSFDDLPDIGRSIPLSPLLSPRRMPINLKIIN